MTPRTVSGRQYVVGVTGNNNKSVGKAYARGAATSLN